MESIIIIGSGHAGFATAAALRKFGFTREVFLLGKESALPYQRPPLSKSVLKSEGSEDRLSFKPDSYYSQNEIRLNTSTAVVEIDTAVSRVSCEDGRTFDYGKLVIATGACPIHLDIPGVGLDGVFHLRNLRESVALRRALKRSKQLIVIGGGFIGLEVAAAARQLGLGVVVI